MFFFVVCKCKVEMVDWATQDRLFPSGYQQVDIRYRRISIDSSLPYSVSPNKSNFFFKYQKTKIILIDRTQLLFTSKRI